MECFTSNDFKGQDLADISPPFGLHYSKQPALMNLDIPKDFCYLDYNATVSARLVLLVLTRQWRLW